MKRTVFAALTAALLLPAAPAYAGDIETWDWFEARVPLTDGQYGMPNSLRLFTDARFGTRFPQGMGQLFFRVGPIWELHPNLFLGVHDVVYANMFNPETNPGEYEIIHRPEIEPNLRGRFGDFTFNDRNRFEYAMSSRGSAFFRYRNQLRVNYQPQGRTMDWFPYAWNEALFQGNVGFNQNRASVGFAHTMSKDARLDLGYVLRSRSTSAGPWDHDHVFNVYLFFAPKVEPAYPESVIPGGSGD